MSEERAEIKLRVQRYE